MLDPLIVTEGDANSSSKGEPQPPRYTICEHFNSLRADRVDGCTPQVELLFNEVYDTEHVPNLLKVPGVRSVTRMKGEPARFAIAGTVRELPAPSPIYTAIYEIDDPQVLESPQWAEAVERGRWPSEVRPHTSNRQHMLFKVK